MIPFIIKDVVNKIRINIYSYKKNLLISFKQEHHLIIPIIRYRSKYSEGLEIESTKNPGRKSKLHNANKPQRKPIIRAIHEKIQIIQAQQFIIIMKFTMIS